MKQTYDMGMLVKKSSDMSAFSALISAVNKKKADEILACEYNVGFSIYKTV